MGVHVFPILNPHHLPPHPSGSSQCTSPKHPVSCIKPGLVIRFLYDSIHVSMPFSQIIPPSPSPTESKRLFYTSVSLLLSGYCWDQTHQCMGKSFINCEVLLNTSYLGYYFFLDYCPLYSRLLGRL